jgi:hypothetical protein
MVLPGLSESLATGWPLQRVSFITMCSVSSPMSLQVGADAEAQLRAVGEVPVQRSAVGMSSPSENTSRLVWASMRSRS